MALSQGTKPYGMNCLDGLIGDDFGCATRTGRLYLKDIGITEDFIAAILTKSDQSTATFMADRRRHATAAIPAALVGHYANSITQRTFIDRDRVGRYPDDEVLINGDANYAQGIVIEVCTPASNTRLLVTTIEFYGETTGPVVVTFHDLRDGTVIATETITAVAGQVSTLDVDLSFHCFRDKKRILITTDQDVYYRSTINASGGCKACGNGGIDRGIFKAKAMRILNTDKKIGANLLPAHDCGGLSVIATLECDSYGWICEAKASVALPLLYFMGWDIFTLALNNYQRWGITNIRKEDIASRAEQLGGMYNSAMDDLYKTMPIPDDGVCFVCDERLKSAMILPS